MSISIFLLLFSAVFHKTVAFQRPSSCQRLQQQSQQLLEQQHGDDSSSSSICLPKTAVWSEVRITTGQLCTDTLEMEALKHFQKGESVLLLKDLVSEQDCRALVIMTATTAQQQQLLADQQHGTNKNGMTRLPTIDAAKRAAATNTPCAESLNEEADYICQRILRRSVETIDEQLPSLSLALFGGKIEPLLTNNGLAYSSREPAVNVYTTGGQFLAHEDGQKLTVLIVLGCDSDFEGGGTAFWSPDSRGHRVDPPSLILKPKPGTAMLFAGHVTHAGLSLTSGCRVVFVASFSPKSK